MDILTFVVLLILGFAILFLLADTAELERRVRELEKRTDGGR